MKTKNLLYLATFLLGILTTSCKKEEPKTRGCTDVNSVNYNSAAEEDDGSCMYEGTIVFWTKPTCAYIDVYLDGKFQGNVSVVHNTAPDCGATGALTVKVNLGSDKSKVMRFTATHPADFCGLGEPELTWDQNITFTANTCTSYEIK